MLIWIAGFTWWNFEWSDKPPKTFFTIPINWGTATKYNKFVIDGRIYYVYCHDAMDLETICRAYENDVSDTSEIAHGVYYKNGDLPIETRIVGSIELESESDQKKVIFIYNHQAKELIKAK